MHQREFVQSNKTRCCGWVRSHTIYRPVLQICLSLVAAGLDVISLEVMFPITLGANIGTTVTGILAALVSSKATAMQVALAHLFFNISGIIIFYPIPWMRQWPLKIARWLGLCTRRNKFFPIFYIVFTFFVFPLTLLGISILWAEGIGNGTGNVGDQGSPGLLTLAILLTVALVLIIAYYTYQVSLLWEIESLGGLSSRAFVSCHSL